jgi:16S rRNA (cytosine1402-N4)-methyltransferase
MFHRRRFFRSTRAGEHRPVLLDTVLACLDPQPGEVVVDCTLGYAGHSLELLKKVSPPESEIRGKLFSFDLDGQNIPAAQTKLGETGGDFVLTHGNFAGFPTVLGQNGLDGCDVLLADLGMSSMQVDDANRGFSFMRDGPLDMRMDPSRGRSAAELLKTLPASELADAFREFGDEPKASLIAEAIVLHRETETLETTWQLRELIKLAAPVKVNPHPKKGEPTVRQQEIRPTARVFQALRILVNRELSNLQELLRALPWSLRPGGRAAIISFHSGEDRLVKAAFKEGLRTGLYSAISEDPVRSTFQERQDNPRARSAKLRWAKRAILDS